MSQASPAQLRLARWFTPALIERAAQYLRDGRVHIVKPPPWPVVARVRGDEGLIVTVYYDEMANRMRGECSCGATLDCEHVAAVTLAGIEAELAGDQARGEAAKQEVVAEWLAEMGRLLPGAAGAAASPAGSERVVAYVLDVKDGEPGLTVMQATRLARGGLGAGAVIGALGDPQRGAPSWVETDDLRRIAMLRAVTRAAPHTTRLPLGRIHLDLLEELAASGRLFWEHTRGTPLGFGPPRADRLAWREVDGEPGMYRHGIGAALVIAPARDCCYVDPAAALFGPLELGVPAELVQRLIAGPAVPASMRATVARSLAPLLGDGPAPPVDSDAMRPHLRAGLDRDTSRGAALTFTAEAGYGDLRFALGGWDPTRDHPRDLVSEGRHQARLQALLDELPHRGRARSSLELLADARHVAELLIPRLRSEGWRCEVDDDFPHQAPLADVTFVESLRPMAESRDWFSVELGVTVAGRTVSLLPLLLQALRDGELVVDAGAATLAVGSGLNLRLPEGELIHVPAERLARWLRPLVELELRGLADDDLHIPAFVAAGFDDDALGRFGDPGALDRVRDQLAALVELAPRHEPADFGGTLRPYQRLGLAWLHALHDAGLGGLLADDMGLGKTVQLLAFLDELAGTGALAAAPALVVAPRSVVGTWAREAARFAPRLAPHIHLGSERAHGAAALGRHPLIITSYQTFARDQSLFASLPWTTAIFDEAQALKNPDTQLRIAAATVRATSRFAVTGTPIENHLGELWSQLDLAVPGILGRRRAFDATIRRPIEEHAAAVPLEHLRRRIRPFLLRRNKDEVALDLPPKTEIVESVELDSDQRDLYEALRLKLDTQVQAALLREGVHGSSMVILDALLKLRQCCCDPRLVKLPEARAVQGSAKLERLITRLEELAGSGRATLVFSQFTSMLALIERACAAAGITTVKLTGATRDRDDVIRRFQAGEAPVMLISLKAGGVGINLTRADTVIHYDPWWNPAAEAQATDRAHRIGQDRPVMVYKLVARGTLEEAILTLQDDKRALGAAALRDGGVTHLAAGDLAALYQQVAAGAILDA